MQDPRELVWRVYGTGAPFSSARAPGRANIIGEHTDYNDGWVLPFAVPQYTWAAVRSNSLGTLRIVSDVYDQPIELPWPKEPDPGRSNHWSDYVAGIVWTFVDRLAGNRGLDIGITSSVPVGGGMSSSAALEVSLCLALASHLGHRLEDHQVIEHCHVADLHYVGIQCGVLDQSASLMAKRDHALLLDTRSLQSWHIPLRLSKAIWVIIDSGIRRALTTTGYAARLEECREALRQIRTHPGMEDVASLRDLQPEDLTEATSGLDETLRNRVHHVVRENQRVHEAVGALQEGDAAQIGGLLSASHASLRDFYEVSIPEIDTLVDIGHKNGAFGARIMGGGFGGVTLHLVPEELAETYVRDVTSVYESRCGYPAAATIVHASSGARELLEEAA